MQEEGSRVVHNADGRVIEAKILEIQSRELRVAKVKYFGYDVNR